MFLTINGVQHYLWRAVDQEGAVLDILVLRRRNTKAAKRFFKRLLKGLRSVPRVVVTGKAGLSTTALRIRTSRPANASGG